MELSRRNSKIQGVVIETGDMIRAQLEHTVFAIENTLSVLHH
jgi:hypothetical protein